MAHEKKDHVESDQQDRVIQQKIRVIKYQDGHADRSADDDVDQIHQQDRDRPLHENGFDEEICKARFKALVAQVRELLSHGNGDPGENATLQHFDRVILQGPEGADK